METIVHTVVNRVNRINYHQFIILSVYYIMPIKVQGGRRTGSRATFRPGGNAYTNRERSLKVRTLTTSENVNTTELHIGGTRLTNSGLDIGGTRLTNSGLDIGGTTITNSGLDIGGTTLTNSGLDIGGTTITNDDDGNAILSLQSSENIAKCFIKSCGPSNSEGQHQIEFVNNVGSSQDFNYINFNVHNGNQNSEPQTVLRLLGTGVALVTGNNVVSGDIVATGDITGHDITASGDIAANDIAVSGNIAATVDITASDIRATGDITATDITANNEITAEGNITGANFPSSSDDRIKENKKLIVNATETLSKLTPQIYDKYRTMDLSGNFQVESGLIAQEVYYNAPELRHLVGVGKEYDASGNDITPTPEEMDLSGVDIGNDPDYGSHGWSKTEKSTLNYSGLIAYLIKSNQEMAERLAALEAK